MKIDDSALLEFLLGRSNASEEHYIAAELGTDPSLGARLDRLADLLAQVDAGESPSSHSSSLADRIGQTFASDFATSKTAVPAYPGFVARVREFFDISDANAQGLLAQIAAAPERPWLPSGIPGVFVLPVVRAVTHEHVQANLMYIAAGANIPRHRHRGCEQMLILDGYAREDSGRELAPGDFLSSEASSSHEFEITTNRPCIFAVLLEQGVDFC